MARGKDAETSKTVGMRLRSGLPSDNGLAPLAPELSKDRTRIVYFVGAMKVKDVVQHVDSDSEEIVGALIGVEADLNPNELKAAQLILDRARVRRTGEQPLFDTADAPANVTELLPQAVEG